MLYAQCLLSDIWNCARYILNQKLLKWIGVFYKSQAFFLMLYKSFNLTRWKKTILPVAATAPRSHIINSLSVSFSCMFSIHLLLRLQLMVHRWIFVHDTHFLCKFFSLWRYDILKKLYVFIKTKEYNLYWFIMNLTWFILLLARLINQKLSFTFHINWSIFYLNRCQIQGVVQFDRDV